VLIFACQSEKLSSTARTDTSKQLKYMTSYLKLVEALVVMESFHYPRNALIITK